MPHRIAVIGGSAGGMESLATILSALPPAFPLPIAAVLHRAHDSGEALRSWLQASSRLPVLEPRDKDPLLPGRVYLAPADYHLLIEKDRLALSTDELVNWARPAIDVLFESAADSWAEQSIGVVLSGGNADGARGLARIKQRGGLAIVQDLADAKCAVMPKAAIAATTVDRVLRVSEIAPFLAAICGMDLPATGPTRGPLRREGRGDAC